MIKKMIFCIPLSSLNAKIRVAINMSEAEILTYYRRQKINRPVPKDLSDVLDGWDQGFPGTTCNFPGQAPLVLLRDDKGKSEFLNTVAHEIAHVAHYLLGDMGAALNESTVEIYCSLQGFLVGEIYKRIWGDK